MWTVRRCLIGEIDCGSRSIPVAPGGRHQRVTFHLDDGSQDWILEAKLRVGAGSEPTGVLLDNVVLYPEPEDGSDGRYSSLRVNRAGYARMLAASRALGEFFAARGHSYLVLSGIPIVSRKRRALDHEDVSTYFLVFGLEQGFALLVGGGLGRGPQAERSRPSHVRLRVEPAVDDLDGELLASACG